MSFLTSGVAHTDALMICGILHRDISAGNILLSLDGTGILNDWDMARKVEDIRKGPRQPCRTVSAISNSIITILTFFLHN